MLDRLEDSVLWQIARSQKSPANMERYDQLLSTYPDRSTIPKR